MHHQRNLGKATRTLLDSVVFKSLGARRPQVLVGPKYGFDNSIIKLPTAKVLVSTADPLSLIPAIGARQSAWMSVHLLASDLCTSGFSPQYGVFDLSLPPSMTDRVFTEYWRALHQECKSLGIAIVGGHTGRYEGCNYTIIGGGTMMAVGPRSRYLTPGMARDGDEVILTKSAAIETTAVLTRAFPKTVKAALGPERFEAAWNYLEKVTTVRDALSAVSVGVRDKGVTAMHDATEGGIIAAMLEMADASGLGLVLLAESLPVSEETKEICNLFHINPLTSLGEGSLVIASRPNRTSRIVSRLYSNGVEASVVGRLSSKVRGLLGMTSKGRVKITKSYRDPYWGAYWGAIQKGWS